MTEKHILRKRGDFRDLRQRLGNLGRLWLICMFGWSLAYVGGLLGPSAEAMPSPETIVPMAATEVSDAVPASAVHWTLADER